MGTHLFDYQNRKDFKNVVFFCYSISKSICTYGKFAYRKSFVREDQIFFNEFFIIFFFLKIRTAVIRDEPVFKFKSELFEFESVQKSFLNVKRAFGPGKFRACEYFSDRYIYIGAAVAVICMLGRVFQFLIHYYYIRLVAVPAFNMYLFGFVNCVNYVLLDLLIFF